MNAPIIIKSNDRNVQASIQKHRAEKKKTAVFQEAKKNAAISYENQILLNKLVDISNGKWSAVPMPLRGRTSQSTNRQGGGGSKGLYQPTSLNIGYRKKETERIERENQAFARRLFEKQSSVAKSTMEKHYVQTLKYRR